MLRMRKHVMSASRIFALILLNCVIVDHEVSAQGLKHYCSRDSNSLMETITGETEGSILTLYQGERYYRNNQNCVWLIDAGPNQRVEITVVSSKLQWAPESAICPGYDHVAIKEGKDGSEESIVLQWCRHTQPLGAVSRDRYLRIEFMSDKNNPYNYEGVHLTFKTFSSSDCAPSWNLHGNHSADFCYKLLNRETDWSSAQRACNAESANLVSVVSEQEYQFLMHAFQSATETAWIGLSDIEELGQYHWIDSADLTIDKFGENHAVDQYSRCVLVDFATQAWKNEDCDQFSTHPLCKSKRGSKTEIFAVPQQKRDEKNSGLPTGRVVLIVVCVIAMLALIIAGVCIYQRRRGGSHRSAHQSRKTGESSDTHDGAASLRLSAWEANNEPSAPPPEIRVEGVMVHPNPQGVAPPAYEEVVSHRVLPAYSVD